MISQCYKQDMNDDCCLCEFYQGCYENSIRNLFGKKTKSTIY